MFFSYQDNCLIGICCLESHENKSEGSWCSWITATHFFFSSSFPWDATDHSLIPLCCLCKSHVAAVDIHSPARLWLDTKLSCCLHQPWLRGLSGLCSDAVWVWRRYSNKAIRVELVWIKYCMRALRRAVNPTLPRWTPTPRSRLRNRAAKPTTQQVALCRFADHEWALYLENPSPCCQFR